MDENDAGGMLSPDRIFSALRRRLIIVIALPLLALIAATVYVRSLPNRYDAFAVVQIDPRKKSISNMDLVISELKADGATIESEAEIINSRAITLKVIDLLGLRNDPEFQPQPTLPEQLFAMAAGAPAAEPAPEPAPTSGSVNSDPIKGYIGPDRLGETRPGRDLVAIAFTERLSVLRVRSTLLIEIRFSSADPVKAAKIANTVAEVYLAEQLTTKQEVSAHASKLLEQKLEGMKAQLSERERRVAAYKARNNIFESEGQILGEKHLARLMEQTVNARNATAQARAKYELAERLANGSGNAAGIADVLQSHTVTVLKDQLAKATGREAELATRYGDKHPEMLKVRAEVNEARSQLATEIGRLVANVKNELTVAEERERELVQALDALKSEDTASKEASVELNDLVRDAETSRALYEALLSRYKQTVETQGLQLPDARIVEQADAPLAPAAPKRKQIVLIATAGGGVFGILIALMFEFLTFGIGRPEDVERVFELAHLASLPASAATDAEGTDQMRAARLMIAEPSSSFAEAIRALRREVDVRRTDDSPRTILVTSSLPNDGGSIVASNLAHHYAMTGARVLLIDGDIRRANLTRKLAVGRRLGLGEILTRSATIDDAMLYEASTGLHFLPASGPAPSKVSPAELLASLDMAKLAATLRNEFDVLVVDAPPLLPVLDGRILADQADQIVFVMAWRRTPKQLARKALATLGFNQRKLVGIVVNHVDDAIIADAIGLPRTTVSMRPGLGGVHLERAA
ncbi:MAG: polysaccharide biosynthesis tyrosine autokinase [Hyphomicrobiaceae bacterium]|nr:polysaccharide biosynthesis tyrosine autokinase [Hyphomicrobiaceae bacterium]